MTDKLDLTNCKTDAARGASGHIVDANKKE